MKNLIQKWNSINLIKRIICGLIVGIILGLAIPQASVISILGDLFVGALRGIAPLKAANEQISLPLVTTVVEQSKKNGYGSAGIATAIGLEPSIAFLPKVGTMIASELVHAIPRRPSWQAMFA